MPKVENAHTKLVNDAICELGKHPEYGKFFKRNTGRARHIKDTDKIIAYGIRGAADIEGWLNNGYGTHVECEIKTGKGVQSQRQLNFEAMMASYGAVYFVAHTLDEVMDRIKLLNSDKPDIKFFQRD